MTVLVVMAAGVLVTTPRANADSVEFDLTNGIDTWNWQLDSNPAPTSFVSGDEFLIHGPIPADFNGSPNTLCDLEFFSDASGGGVDGFSGSVFCQSTNLVFSLFGEQLYTGSEATPTFKTGEFSLAESEGGQATWHLNIVSQAQPVPEPASLLLMGTGFAMVAWRRYRKGNRNST